MTWRQWWLVEAISGPCVVYAIWPLDWERIVLTVALVTLFSYAYHKRVQGQIAAKGE